jgi:dephospho-CoA kinase
MIKIALTGGIGSGKSSSARVFQTLGIPVLSADTIARQLLQHDSNVKQAVTAYFGTEIYANDNIQAHVLAQRIFSDQGAKQKLEAILHPKIRHAIAIAVAEHHAPYVIIEVPLLIESGFSDYDRILVIDCDREHQLTRSMQRDKRSAAHVKKIIAAQASREQRLAHADDIINNNGTLTELEQHVRQLDQYYRRLAQTI